MIRIKVSSIVHQFGSWGDGALVKSWTTDLRVGDSKPLVVDRFPLIVNFDGVLSALTKKSKSIVWSGSQALHQSFRALTVVLLPPTSSP